MTPFRRRLRRLRRALGLGLAAILILAAVLVGLLNLALPWLASDPARMAAWIESRLGQPVRVEAVGAQWLRSGPAFRLTGLRLGGSDGIDVEAAELRVNVYAWLLPKRPLVELRLTGLDLEVARAEGSAWELRGLILPERTDAPVGVAGISLPGALSVRDSRLRVRDEVSGLDLSLERVNLSYSRSGETEHWNGSGWPADGTSPLGFVVERRGQDGRAYLVGRELALTEWIGDATPVGIGVREGLCDLAVWLDWKGRQLREARLEMALSGLQLRGAQPLALGDLLVEPRVAIDRMEFGARWRGGRDGWRLDVEDLLFAGPFGEDVTRALSLVRHDRTRFTIEAQRIPVAPLASFVALADRAPPALRGWLYASAPNGRIEDVRVELDADQLAWVQGHVDGLHVRPHLRIPGFGPLSFPFHGDRHGLVAGLVGQYPLLDAPRLFARAQTVSGLAGRIGIAPGMNGWSVEMADGLFSLDGVEIAVEARVDIDAVAGPVLSAAATVGPGRIEKVHDYWPERILPVRTQHWLRSALVAGDLQGGVAVFHGALREWPFAGGEGRFEALASVTGSTLAFNPEWPAVEQLDARVRFVDRSMRVEAGVGTILGNTVRDGRAEIADLRNAVLDVHVDGSGRGPQLLGLLRRSPINDRFGSYLIGVEIGGRADVELDLRIPLKRELGPHTVAGSIWMREADLRDAKWDLAFDRATGRVRFDQGGFAADELQVWLGDDPAHLSIAVGSGTGRPENLAEASLRGRLPLASVTSGFPDLEPLWHRVQGRSLWTLDLAVGSGENGSDGATRLLMHSDMVGAGITLPAPLGKAPAQALPVRMEITLPAIDGRLDLEIGDLARMRARLPGPTQSFAAAVALGGDWPAAVPEDGLHVRGTLAELDLSGWMALAGAGTQAGGLDIAARAGRLSVLGSVLEDVELVVRRDPLATEIAFTGPQVQGILEVPGDRRRGVTANFERLHWPGGGSGEAGAIDVDPALLPPTYLWIGDLKLGAVELGETRLETYPTPRGLQVSLFESRAPQVDLRARGAWQRTATGDRSRFELDFSAQNLGRMLDAFGYSGFVEGGQTLATFDVAWPGSPAAFSLDRLSGSLEISIGSGRILDVEPGAGRILGLASLQAIPRRLALDFSDLFSPGMSFNAISGSFRFADGSAWTEDLRLDGPSAAVGIRGRTGLADRSYDQELDVYPRVGGALPVFGAIAGGPAGAAAGLVVQNVLARPLDQVARARYRVTGSWDDPQIQQIPVPRPRSGPSGSG